MTETPQSRPTEVKFTSWASFSAATSRNRAKGAADRTSQEVDFVLVKSGRPIAAIEAKTGALRGRRDFLGLRAMREDYPSLPLYIVTDERSPREGGTARPRSVDADIEVYPWRDFLDNVFPTL